MSLHSDPLPFCVPVTPLCDFDGFGVLVVCITTSCVPFTALAPLVFDILVAMHAALAPQLCCGGYRPLPQEGCQLDKALFHFLGSMCGGATLQHSGDWHVQCSLCVFFSFATGLRCCCGGTPFRYLRDATHTALNGGLVCVCVCLLVSPSSTCHHCSPESSVSASGGPFQWTLLAIVLTHARLGRGLGGGSLVLLRHVRHPTDSR